MSISKRLWAIVICCILVMVIFEGGMQIQNNTQSAIQTTGLLLDQIVSTAKKNDASDKDLETSLKEEYIIRARSAAYVVQNIPGIGNNVEELQKIARMLSVDEIHLFDKNGRIYGGSVPKYYGMTMDDGAQIGFFKPMLKNRELSLCQNLTPNTAEEKSMMYAMVWNEARSGLVQVGIEPVRLLEEIQSHAIPSYIDSIPVVEGESVLIVNQEDGVICGSTNAEAIGKNLRDYGITVDEENLDKAVFEKVNGEYIVCKFAIYNGYIIGVTYSLLAANKNVLLPMVIVLVYLLLAAVIIFRYMKRLETMQREKTVLSKTSNTDELTQLLNKRAFYHDTEGFKKNGIPADFAMLSMDINGLKEVNDTFGHAAGDELIRGAAECMRQVLGKYGSIYRTGGDEFIAIVHIGEGKLPELRQNLLKRIAQWQGKLSQSLSVSVGTVLAKETKGMRYEEVEKLADSRMYQAKRAYYSQKGVDRREAREEPVSESV